MLACPIFVDPQSSRGVGQVVLGVLSLCGQEHPFDEYESLVQQVTNQCASAIWQVQL